MSLLLNVLYAEKDEAAGFDYVNDEIHIASHIEPLEELFFLDTVDKVKQLTLRKIPLKNDVIANIDVGYGSTDWMIEQYAKFM